MGSKIFKVVGALIICFFIVIPGIFIVKKADEKKTEKAKIISTNFVSYDFARAVVGDSSEIKMLLKPGTEAHNFDPTPEDIINIKNADLFIYIGGESDEWVKKLLSDNEISSEKTLRLMDFIDLKTEETVEGMEETESEETEEVEYDEHIWTSPKNAIKLVSAIRNRLVELRENKKDEYNKNTEEYIRRIDEIDQKFREIIENGNKKELIFADRFPFRYFVDEYGLKYYAAFPGCSEQTEASTNTIAFLINKIKEDNIKVVLKIELTNDKLAKTIADETNAKVLEFNAAHNISESDFKKGVTYLDIMEKNTRILAEALE